MASSVNSEPPWPTNNRRVRVRSGPAVLESTSCRRSATVASRGTERPSCNTTPLPNASTGTWSLSDDLSCSCSGCCIGDCVPVVSELARTTSSLAPPPSAANVARGGVWWSSAIMPRRCYPKSYAGQQRYTNIRRSNTQISAATMSECCCSENKNLNKQTTQRWNERTAKLRPERAIELPAELPTKLQNERTNLGTNGLPNELVPEQTILGTNNRRTNVGANELPSELPNDLPNDVPNDLPNELQNELQSEVQTNIPNARRNERTKEGTSERRRDRRKEGRAEGTNERTNFKRRNGGRKPRKKRRNERRNERRTERANELCMKRRLCSFVH